MRSDSVFLPFPAESRARVPPTTRVKGVWLASSLRSLRARSRFDAYLTALPREHHDVVLGAVAGDWLPIDLLVAHYAACDRLGIPEDDIVALGRDATRHAHGVVVGMLVRLAGAGAITPWTVASQLQKLWDRVFVGGGVGVFKLGPSEMRLELVQFPCCQFDYCRVGLRGVLLGLMDLFCTNASVQELASFGAPSQAAIRISWA